MSFTEFFRALTGGGGKARLMATDIAADQYFALPAVGGTSGSPAMIATGTLQAYDFLANLVNAEISIGTTANLTISTMHVCSGTSADYTVTLPAVAASVGKFVGVRMAPALTKLVTVKGNVAELIDGVNTRIMWANEVAILYCDGLTWTKVGGKSIPMSGTLGVAGAQTITAVTKTLLTFSTSMDLNAPAAFQTPATYRHTILRPGKYQIFLNGITDVSNSSATYVLLLFYKNGAEMGRAVNYAQAALNQGLSTSQEVTLAVGDYIQPYGYFQTGNFTASFLIDDSTNHVFNKICLTEKPTW